MRRIALAILTLAIAACETPARERLVLITLGGSGPCTVDLDERRFVLPAEEAALTDAARRLASTHAGALLSGADGLSFACYRTAMTVIDGARFRRLGYVSDFVPEE